MPSRGRDLASRFRDAIDRQQDERKLADQAREQRLEEARQARSALLQDVLGVMKSIGVIEITELEEGGFECRFEGRLLVFKPTGNGDRVEIEWCADAPSRGFSHDLYREEELGRRWVYRRIRPGQDDRLPLFDAGLEAILVQGLGLPEPG